MRVLTANIQNFPASAPDEKYPAKERADLATIEGLKPDIVLWQELAEKRDFTDVIGAFGNATYGTAAHESECLITWHRDLLTLKGTTATTKVADGMGKGTHSPARYICMGDFSVAGLPDVTVIGLHFTNGAYIGPKLKARQPHWDSAYEHTKTQVLKALTAGNIVIVGGDWNRMGKDIAPFHSGQKWVVGGGNNIDNIAVLCPPGWSVNATHSINRNINSDHNLRGADLNFERNLSTAEQKVIGTLAKARTTLRDMKGAQATKAAGHLQDAINDLYGL